MQNITFADHNKKNYFTNRDIQKAHLKYNDHIEFSNYKEKQEFDDLMEIVCPTILNKSFIEKSVSYLNNNLKNNQKIWK